ncbi:MAG TPA: DUF1569 domain-containing protein [Gemmatimonadaceae bacterium]|jgi:hypothetical protein|nr:DUF1569 domain-containing protein [Gemmatimonadaceae bacterium]
MRSLWQEPARRELLTRLEKLTPTTRGAWGRMTAPEMICHINESIRMCFGDIETKAKRVPWRHPPLKQLVMYWLPWPKGVPTAPELLARVPTSWDTDVAECRALIERFGTETRKRDVWPRHPAFGSMTAEQWGRLTYRHMDHHWTQFNI